MQKPNFFIVGAPKCGTTAWYAYLRTHPDIFLPERKEPHYFAADLPKRRMISSEEDYLDLFRHTEPFRYRGEASVYYLFSKVAANLISRFDPSARILILLRNQENMLPSLHQQHLYSFEEGITDFQTAWRLSGNRPPDTISKTCRETAVLDYAAVGRFHEQVERYFKAFPAEQILVLQFEEWTRDPRSTYLKILDFLGLQDDGRCEFPKVNEARTHRLKRLGKFMQHPPKVVARTASFAKNLLGIGSFGLARANQRPGYPTKISSDIREEIKAHFLHDNEALGKLLREHGK